MTEQSEPSGPFSFLPRKPAELHAFLTRIAMEGIIRRLPSLDQKKQSEETHVLTGGALSVHLGFGPR